MGELWLAFKASRAFKPVLIVGAVLLMGVLLFALGYFSRKDDHGQAEQAKQTTRSGEAISTAAQDAISIIGERVATDHNIDQATQQAVSEIGVATSADQVRDAVLQAVCQQKVHSHDPACLPPTEKAR